jgi:hypothetical protein
MNSKQSVKKIFILVAGIFLVVASRSGNFAAVPFAYAQEDCSLATLNGEYLVTGTVQARIDQRDDPTLPRIVVAVWTFDGKGNFTTHAIQNFGGDYREVDQIGTYAVEPGRCVATMTFPPEMGAAVFRGPLTRDGREADVIRMDPDETGRVTLASRHLKKR